MGDGLKPRGKTGQSPKAALPGVLGCPLQAPITKECTHDVHALLPLAVKYGAIQQAGKMTVSNGKIESTRYDLGGRYTFRIEEDGVRDGWPQPT